MSLYDHAFAAQRVGVAASTLLITMSIVLLPIGEIRGQGMQPGMKDMPGMGQPKQATTATGAGTVVAVNIQSRKVTLDHGPIPDIKWPAMKMEFATAPSVDLSKVKAGDKVRFTLSGSGNLYTVQSINPAQ